MSLSATIEADKKSYYDALKKGQRSNHINDWIDYFGNMLLKSQEDFIEMIAFSLRKMRFFDNNRIFLNKRQEKVMARMLAEEGEFVGGMNAKKYQAITKTSKATATRDLQDLIEKQLIVSKGAGRNTNYQVNLDV